MRKEIKRTTRENRILRDRVRRMTIVLFLSVFIVIGQVAIMSATTAKDEPMTEETFYVAGKIISMETEGQYDVTYYHSLKLESEDGCVSFIVNVSLDTYTYYVKGDTLTGYLTGENVNDMAFHTNVESSKVVWYEKK